jgi:hypothetical protein
LGTSHGEHSKPGELLKAFQLGVRHRRAVQGKALGFGEAVPWFPLGVPDAPEVGKSPNQWRLGTFAGEVGFIVPAREHDRCEELVSQETPESLGG